MNTNVGPDRRGEMPILLCRITCMEVLVEGDKEKAMVVLMVKVLERLNLLMLWWTLLCQRELRIKIGD